MTGRPVPYFDLKGQYADIEAEWFEAIRGLGRTGNFILGPAIEELEKMLCQFLRVAHAVTVSSGTDALVLALRAVGVRPGQSVIVPNFGFFATPEAVSLIGATPRFVDIRKTDFTIDPAAVEAAIDSSTAAILPVHLFGCPADMQSIRDVAGRHGIAVVEDAAQSFGASEKGLPTGGLGDAGCFSFYPTKILGAFGDGGMVTTNDDSLGEQLRLMRNHGIVGANRHALIGCTSRLNTVQAKLLELKLANVETAIARRREIADAYRSRLSDLDVVLPGERDNAVHVYNIFTIRTSSRDTLASALEREQIGFQIYYPSPLHEQKPYANGSVSQCAPYVETAAACSEAISLPLYPEMPDAHVEQVCQVVRGALS